VRRPAIVWLKQLFWADIGFIPVILGFTAVVVLYDFGQLQGLAYTLDFMLIFTLVGFLFWQMWDMKRQGKRSDRMLARGSMIAGEDATIIEFLLPKPPPPENHLSLSTSEVWIPLKK